MGDVDAFWGGANAAGTKKADLDAIATAFHFNPLVRRPLTIIVSKSLHQSELALRWLLGNDQRRCG